jgi:hypothetical protein
LLAYGRLANQMVVRTRDEEVLTHRMFWDAVSTHLARADHRICSGCHGSVADPLGSRGRLGASNGARQYVREVGDAEPSMRGGNTPRRSRAPIS